MVLLAKTIDVEQWRKTTIMAVESAMVESCFVEKDLQKEFMVKEIFDIVWFILNYEPFHHFSRESSRFQRASRYWRRLHAVDLHRSLAHSVRHRWHLLSSIMVHHGWFRPP